MKLNKILETKVTDLEVWSGVPVDDNTKNRWIQQLLNTALIKDEKTVNFITSGDSMVLCVPYEDGVIEMFDLKIERSSLLTLENND